MPGVAPLPAEDDPLDDGAFVNEAALLRIKSELATGCADGQADCEGGELMIPTVAGAHLRCLAVLFGAGGLARRPCRQASPTAPHSTANHPSHPVQRSISPLGSCSWSAWLQPSSSSRCRSAPRDFCRHLNSLFHRVALQQTLPQRSRRAGCAHTADHVRAVSVPNGPSAQRPRDDAASPLRI